MLLLRKITHHFRRAEIGQDYVEFAVIIPILMMLLMGMVDFGRVFNAWILATHGAREGARYAAVGNCAVSSQVRAAMGGLTVTVGVSPAANQVAQGDPITVAVTTDVDLLTAFVTSKLLSDPYPVSGVGVMRDEGPPDLATCAAWQ